MQLNNKTKQKLPYQECPRDVMSNVMVCDIEVTKFELQLL